MKNFAKSCLVYNPQANFRSHNGTRYNARNNALLKQGTGFLLCILLGCWAIWNGVEMLRNPEHPKGAVQSRSAIAQRALRIGAALGGSSRIMYPPTLQEGRGFMASYRIKHRKVWVVLCEAEGQQINMVFDDNNARLICLIMESGTNRQSSHELLPPVKTEQEAICVSVDRLKALEVLPQGAQIALRERPEATHKHSMWEVNWLVRTPKKMDPFTIKIVLNIKTGRPAFMVDLSERS